MSRSLALLLLLGGMASPPAAFAAEASPNADEDCVMQCDVESDKCMAEAGGDENKAKACDDAYTECLKKCR
jgi:hypothetical protein